MHVDVFFLNFLYFMSDTMYLYFLLWRDLLSERHLSTTNTLSTLDAGTIQEDNGCEERLVMMMERYET